MTNDQQMERTVLGAMMLSPAGFQAGLELSPGDFTLDWHRRTFTRMVTMHGAGMAVDGVTLVSELLRTGEIEAVGGAGYLSEHVEGVPHNFVPAAYVGLLKKGSQRRSILAMAEVLRSRAEQGDDPEDILADHSSAVSSSQVAAATVRPTRISEYIVPVIQEIERQRSASGEVLGISCGIPALDLVTTGWRDGELTYIGALPGRGKSSFMLQAMYEAASQGIGVGCISLEMRATQLVRRLAILHASLAPRKFRDPRGMNPSEYAHAKRSLISLGDMPIHIVDQSGLNPGQIASQARQMYEAGARLITVDFVQIIREDGRDRREAINRVSGVLRDTCKSLGIPFLVASQLARGDKDLNRRPVMQDLRESGNLEQDAHNVLLLYRPVDGENEWTREDEIIVAKQREGLTGRVEVAYSEATLTFTPRQAAQKTTPISAGRTGTQNYR